jgi:hypothetical protein
MHEMEAQFSPTDNPIPIPEAVASSLVALRMEAGQHRLTSTEQKCTRIMDKCHAQPVTYREIVADLKDLRERLEDELKGHLFFHLTPQEAELHEQPTHGWHTVITRFPKAKTDIEDSSKCLAFGMYAASVFHILLVAEFGVIEVAKLFKVEGDKPGWGALERLEKINKKDWKDKSSLEQQHSEFLKNLTPLALAIKDSWRHKISHAENKLTWVGTDFSQRTADEIITATRGFMRRIAQDLPK